jgi:hypothetical protein
MIVDMVVVKSIYVNMRDGSHCVDIDTAKLIDDDRLFYDTSVGFLE